MNKDDCCDLLEADCGTCVGDQDTPVTNTDTSRGGDERLDDNVNFSDSEQKSSKVRDTAPSTLNENDDRINSSLDSLDKYKQAREAAPNTDNNENHENSSLDSKQKSSKAAARNTSNEPARIIANDERSNDSNEQKQYTQFGNSGPEENPDATDKPKPRVEINQNPPDTRSEPKPYSSSDQPLSTTDNTYDKSDSLSSITSGQSIPYGLESESSDSKSTQRHPIDQLYKNAGLNDSGGNVARYRNSIFSGFGGLDSFLEDFNPRTALALLCSLAGSGLLLCVLKSFFDLFCQDCYDYFEYNDDDDDC